MMCTGCGKAVRPVVGLDIDGTMSDYHGPLIRFAAAWTGRNMPPAGQYDGSVRIAEFLGMDDNEYRTMKLAYRQGGFKRLQPIVSYANRMAHCLTDAGAEVWVTTTRPYQRFDSTDPDTRHWLDRHGITYDHLLYDDDKYKVLADTVGAERVVGVLDDLPANYDRAEELGLQPIFFQTSYNRAFQRPRSVARLAQATGMLRGAIETWKREHSA